MTSPSKKQLEELLQASLTDAWQAFRVERPYRELARLYEHLCTNGFYEGVNEHILPNPAYQMSTPYLVANAIKKAAGAGIAFDAPFPGLFEESAETTDGTSLFTRAFRVNALINKKIAFVVITLLQHRHDRFDLPDPPLVRVYEPDEAHTHHDCAHC